LPLTVRLPKSVRYRLANTNARRTKSDASTENARVVSASGVDAEAERVLQGEHLVSDLHAPTAQVCIVRVRDTFQQIFYHEDQFVEALRWLRNEGCAHLSEGIAGSRVLL
jgi:hypothetical protein